jgi:ketosteroid isomerase-like protein
MQYLVSVIDDTADLARWRASGASARPDEMAAIDAFNDRLAAEGHWVFAGGLAAPGTATVIDNRGGEALFTDGPFVESKEYLGGLWIIEAADLDVVLKLAAEGSKACNRKVEVRPFALMTTETETTAQEQIRTLLNDRAAAITAKDARRAVAHLAPEVVSFGLAPPLRDAGDEARDPAGIEGWFGTWDGPIGYDIGELVIEAGDDVAFCHGLTHMTGTKTDGEQVDLWFRSTVGLRRTAAGWQITHEHDSTPFYMDGSGRAATDLRP